MATAILLPRQGQTVESCIIAAWKKQVGDPVAAGDVLAEVETDKAMLEVESTAEGVLLAQFFQPGDDVPVLTAIAAVGQAGEDISALRPDSATPPPPAPTARHEKPLVPANMATAAPPPVGMKHRNGAPPRAVAQPDSQPPPVQRSVVEAQASATHPPPGISPRARTLAAERGINVQALQGSGPGGRVIERDVQAALQAAVETASAGQSSIQTADTAVKPKMTPLAAAMVERGGFVPPDVGSGRGGKITRRDLTGNAPVEAGGISSTPTIPVPASLATGADEANDTITVPVKGVRRVIAARMLESVQTTAQLTLHAPADARALQAYRARLKSSDEALGLRKITINDLVLFAAARTLTNFPNLNALFTGETITQYRRVHLGFAVDTPRGLVVPVIRNADALSLRTLAATSSALAARALEGKLSPDEMNGGTFTVTNLGAFGVEQFTPILNPPQVAILGVGNIHLKPVQSEAGGVEFIPHIGLSLTINHQVVDGAPAARFLQAVGRNIAAFELLLST